VEQVIEFVQTWGYLAVLLGSMVEGESVILTACVLAHMGYMNIYYIMIISFLGTLIADQTLFLVGMKYGPSLFKKYPKLKVKSKRIFDLLEKYDIWFILSFRFIYGIRTLSPLIIGASGKVSLKRFAPLNFLAAVIWVLLSCFLGYVVLGETIEEVLENFDVIKKYFIYVLIAIATLITMGILFYRNKNKIKK
jgi:membrane protein DedA with SNARE-associated domain